MKKFKHIAHQGNSKDTENIKGISMTVPDQSLTVREIMQKYVNGTLNDISTEGNYTKDDEDLRHLDMSDIHDMAVNSSTLIKESVRKSKISKLKLKEDEEGKRRVDEELKKLQEQ